MAPCPSRISFAETSRRSGEWAGDNDLPEKTRIDFYRGEVWIDMGREQVFTHGC